MHLCQQEKAHSTFAFACFQVQALLQKQTEDLKQRVHQPTSWKKKKIVLIKTTELKDGSNKLGHSPCRWYVSRLCNWLHVRMVKLDKDNVLTRNIRTIKSSSNEGML
jgi:hypothetical protein